MDSVIPLHWPRTLLYRRRSFSDEMPLADLRLLLFPPRRSGFLDLIEEARVHPALEICLLQDPHPLAGIRTSKGHQNRGLFASRFIPKGTYLGEYVGKLSFVFPSFGENRENKGLAEFKWSIEHPHFTFTVDAEYGANELALVNDYRSIAAKPNTTPCLIPHKGLHYFGFRTLQSIRPGQELLVDYGEEFSSFLKKPSEPENKTLDPALLGSNIS